MQQSSDLQSWVEWKQRCALGLCSPGAQADLREFAEIRFRHYLRKFVSRTNVGESQAFPDSPTGPWHLFETHLTLRSSEAGKRYKDWLFARVELSTDPPIDVIRGGATLLIRDVVREYLRREFSPPIMQSLEAPCGECDCDTSLEELLPGGIDPSSEVERREFEVLARNRAIPFFKQMSRRERVAFLAKQLDIPLAHPSVQQAAGCGKSMVHAAFGEAVLRLASRLQTDYADDDREAVRLLTLLTLGEINRLVMDWANSESSFTQFFSMVETPAVCRPRGSVQ